MDYKELAEKIFIRIGGQENISHLAHCATRLRITLANNVKIDKEDIKNLKGVLGVVESGGQLQIILGQHVSHIYSEIDKMLSPNDVKTERKTSNKTTKKSIVSTVLDTITGIFTPVLSAITGAAMVKVLLILLTLSELVKKDSDIYITLTFISDTAFFFLPIMLAYSAAQKFKMNPYVAMTLGGVLMHPALTQLKATKGSLAFLGIDIPLISYGSTVIPIILVIWLASYVERLADRISPSSLVFFLKPFLTVLIMAPLALTLIAPLGVYFGSGLGFAINYINSNFTWLLPVIFGIFSPIFIMTGMHYAVTIPLVITSIATYGFDMAGAGFLMANIAQGAAALAVARLAVDRDFKSMANAAGFTGLLGITEPALYGVNLKFRKPFYAVMISGGIAGLYVGFFGVKRLALAPTGLTTLPIFVDPENSINFVHAIIGLCISFVMSYSLTTLFMRKTDIKV
ncbi:PTS transporter subunit EIIC [Pectobacterium brasiliense]|uniref:PTS transporter subunit EIIC n=1 Tax=Pectobacterium brasiliense TaxID=180957 RepID=A0AAE2WE23_9GAMM|nr:PTS transporter subunit EIIC [Pectobacterium brasiliense]MBA0215859.1 PTS transporter subunit EIIC [Pectobacterium brasiliense]MBN3050741.1 PTS transporter subunit EIIC [Pectobacterium brasiliense]MBN3072573.1 PTS transporter subunit EIIC [Pectobacterium brasiliense]MBN3168335.1 PTS transporter subunit EIIC [Pectobacterium brasiliense]